MSHKRAVCQKIKLMTYTQTNQNLNFNKTHHSHHLNFRTNQHKTNKCNKNKPLKKYSQDSDLITIKILPKISNFNSSSVTLLKIVSVLLTHKKIHKLIKIFIVNNIMNNSKKSIKKAPLQYQNLMISKKYSKCPTLDSMDSINTFVLL